MSSQAAPHPFQYGLSSIRIHHYENQWRLSFRLTVLATPVMLVVPFESESDPYCTSRSKGIGLRLSGAYPN